MGGAGMRPPPNSSPQGGAVSSRVDLINVGGTMGGVRLDVMVTGMVGL